MADRSWLEFSDDDEDESMDSSEARRIIEERLRKRKAEAEQITASVRPALQRSSTVCGYRSRNSELGSHEAGSRLLGRSRRRSSRREQPVSCYGLLDGPATLGSSYSSSGPTSNYGLSSSYMSPTSGTRRTSHGRSGSSHTNATPVSPSMMNYPAHLDVRPVDLSLPQTPAYKILEDGDIEFNEQFDIWFTDPASIAAASRGTMTRGTPKAAYESACCFVGSFTKLSEFYAFHNAIDWLTIPSQSVVAYTKKDIKPQWEDTMNACGGRYMFKHFSLEHLGLVFTKIALGFLSGLLTDYHHYNLVSLHVRASNRGTDIQLWRRIHSSNTGISTATALNDIKRLLAPVPKPESLTSLGQASTDIECNEPLTALENARHHRDATSAAADAANDASPISDDLPLEELLSHGTVTWMPNMGSMQKNDNRIKKRKAVTAVPDHGVFAPLTHATSLDSGLRRCEDEFMDMWAPGGYSQIYTESHTPVNGGLLSQKMRKAMIAAADAELASVTPLGASVPLTGDAKLTSEVTEESQPGCFIPSRPPTSTVPPCINLKNVLKSVILGGTPDSSHSTVDSRK